MKSINQFITEKFRLSRDNIRELTYKSPKTKDQLSKLVDKLIKERGNNADLNDIDTAEITDMAFLLSQWDVNNVKNMDHMFASSKFDGDISEWDVTNVINMEEMFEASEFSQDISKWDVSNVEHMYNMFYESPLEDDPPAWY